MPRPPRGSARLGAVVWACVAALAAGGTTGATPYDNIPVGDPIESELRILDLYDSSQLRGRIRLPHLDTRPLQSIELQGLGRPLEAPGPALGISLARLERALGHNRSPLFLPHDRFASTARLYESSSENTRFEISVAGEGRAEREEGDSHLASGSGFHGRVALGLDRLLAFSHYIVGRIDNARRFANVIIPDNDVTTLTEESFISYTEERGQWGMQFGRNRWHWGPGEEGSLVLSRTSPAMTGIVFRAHHAALRADGIALNATLATSAGEQLAAHRIEWQLTDGIRAGLTEAARYRAPGWRPLYLVGFIPYTLVQRLEVQSEPDSQDAHRNNVVMSVDVSWRVADGTRLYGELLLDDLHTSDTSTPNKYGYQLGWEGAGLLGDTRLTWGGEWTRLSRFVYSSFFGRAYTTQGRPIGFPTGPDSRRVRMRIGWDLDEDWTLFARATQTDRGENDINEPFFPGSGPIPPSSAFEGVVATTQEAEVGARWWPASGVYVSLSAGYRSTRNDGHVPGRERRGALAAVEARISR